MEGCTIKEIGELDFRDIKIKVYFEKEYLIRNADRIIQ